MLADLERMDHGDTLERIKQAKPDILMVAFEQRWSLGSGVAQLHIT